ncbi:hypothetical protein F5H01DRAFT_318855 [Linnemannia elongata]|nr:hypothetical protein F5H01DRAFT_318855 [Linnemannia elongata]
MSSNSITNNNAVRLGAAAIIGTVIIYFLWSATASSSSSNKPKDRSSSSSKTTTTTTTTTTTSEKKAVKGVSKEVTEERQDKKVIDEVPAVKAEKITEQKEHEEKPREKEHVKAAEVVPEPVQEPVQEPVAAPIVESTVEEVEEEEEQQTAQEPEIQDASADEFDEEHEVELVFEREIPAAAIVIQEVKEVKEVKEEIIEEAAPAAAEVPEQAEEEPEQVQDVQEEAQVDTPTTLVGDQLEHTKETEETVQVIVETPRKTESWSDVSEDKVQTLQEVSRVAQHSELNAKAAEFKPSWLPSATVAPAKPNGTVANGTPAAEPVKMKSRCRFWPNCTNKSCKFTHPSTYCRDPENCSFGDRCNFIHPNDMTARPPRDKGDKKGARRQTAAGDRKGRPKSSDSSVNMVAASPVDAWSK